jgi:hypothetical protein
MEKEIKREINFKIKKIVTKENKKERKRKDDFMSLKVYLASIFIKLSR